MFWKEMNMSRLTIVKSDYRSGRHNAYPTFPAFAGKKKALSTIKPRVPEPVAKRGATLRINDPDQGDQ